MAHVSADKTERRGLCSQALGMETGSPPRLLCTITEMPEALCTYYVVVYSISEGVSYGVLLSVLLLSKAMRQSCIMYYAVLCTG